MKKIDDNDPTEREALRISTMYCFISSLHLANYYAMELTDKTRPRGPLIIQEERQNVIRLMNSVNRFTEMVWGHSKKHGTKKDTGEELVFENVSAGVELLNVAMQVPPPKIDEFMEGLIELAAKLTRDAFAEYNATK